MAEAPKISEPIVILYEGKKYTVFPDSSVFPVISTLIEMLDYQRSP